MSKKSSLLKTAYSIAHREVVEQTRARICMAFDGAIIAAHEALQMGPGRSAAFGDAYNDAISWLSSLYVRDADNDKDIDYAKGKRDALIKRIVGAENFVPFDLMYTQAYEDELKRVRALNAPQMPLQLGDKVWMAGGKDEAKVIGVCYKGFFVGDEDGELDKFFPWSSLGKAIFANRTEAKING